MTIQKIEFEYDIPEGYRFVRLGMPNKSELYLNSHSRVFKAKWDFDEYWIIVEKIPEQESKKHRWHDFMIEFANDKTLKFQYKHPLDTEWIDVSDNLAFYEYLEYRKKPTKKIVRFRNYLKEDGYVGVVDIKSNAPGFKEWIGDWQEIEI